MKPGGKVDVNIPQDDGDLNAQYEAELQKFAVKPPKEVQIISEEDRQADYYKGFRSAVVLAWVFCNFALGAVVLSAAGLENLDKSSSSSSSSSGSTSGSSNAKRATTDEGMDNRSLIYMEVVLWSVAALSMIKFIGAMWYLVVRMVSSTFLFSTTQALKLICLLVPWRLISSVYAVCETVVVFLSMLRPLAFSGYP